MLQLEWREQLDVCASERARTVGILAFCNSLLYISFAFPANVFICMHLAHTTISESRDYDLVVNETRAFS